MRLSLPLPQRLKEVRAAFHLLSIYQSLAKPIPKMNLEFWGCAIQHVKKKLLRCIQHR